MLPLMRSVGLVVLLALLTGCAHPISSRLRDEIDPQLSFSQILNRPESYVGRKVMLGGTIVETRNLRDYSDIVVVEKELDCTGYPSDGDQSGGRFIFRVKGYVEREIYSKGRKVTGAGTLVGVESGKLDEVEYRYPVVEVEELHLWEDVARYRYPPYPYYWGPYWGPYYPRYFWGPGYPYYW